MNQEIKDSVISVISEGNIANNILDSGVSRIQKLHPEIKQRIVDESRAANEMSQGDGSGLGRGFLDFSQEYNLNEKKIICDPEEWRHSFEGNNNTGTKYEIEAGLFILKSRSNNIKGIINLTQDDKIGTADIGVVYKNGNIGLFSVTLYKGKIAKCIRNSSARIVYGLLKTEKMDDLNEECYQKAMKYRENKFGPIPNRNYKRVPQGRCPGAKIMMEDLAQKASQSWNAKTEDFKRNQLSKILDLDERLDTNSHGIIYWNNKMNCIEHIYKWELKITLDNKYLNTYSDGIYIYHGEGDDYIIKTQAKYNNSIIQGMSSKLKPREWVLKKSPSYLSSWNFNVDNLKKIFKMTKIQLEDSV